MKYFQFLFFLFNFITILSFAQTKATKALINMGYTEECILKTDEKMLFSPRGFIYDNLNQDSVCYFGCVGSDQKFISDYFLQKNKLFLMPINQTILRSASIYTDTILVEPLTKKIRHLQQITTNRAFVSNNEFRYLVLYYIGKNMLDRDFKKNFRYFLKFANLNKEKKIKVVAVLVD